MGPTDDVSKCHRLYNVSQACEVFVGVKRREYPFRHSLRQSTETIECSEEKGINLGKKVRYKKGTGITIFPRKYEGRKEGDLDDQKQLFCLIPARRRRR